MEKETDVNATCFKVAEGVWGLKDIFVNVFFIANPDRSWVLVDAGLKTSYPKIKRACAEIFGEEIPPKAIILTHGHFDHVGSLKSLLADWGVPVIAHFLELPYLTGKSSYPPPDPTVGGGLMSLMSCLYPSDPIDVSDSLNLLPVTHSVPVLPEWKYFHTPGHISLWRESDRLLLAGDAFVTTKQESALHVALQTEIVSGPPKYFTYNWEQARSSVIALANLRPQIVATGHGKPMSGATLTKQLRQLVADFEDVAVPERGRYVEQPAVTNRDGVSFIPEHKSRDIAALILAGTAMLALPLVFWWTARRLVTG